MDARRYLDGEETLEPKAVALVAALVALTYVNDLVFLETETYRSWLAADYAFRVVTLAVIVLSPPLRAACRAFLAWPRPHALALGLVVALAVAGGLAEAFIGGPIQSAFEETRLFVYPEPDSAVLKAIDLTLGLVLVATSEEFVFRVLLPVALLPLVRSPTAIVLATAVLFGAMHWSGGLGQVVTAAVIGALFMVSVFRAGSVWPALIAHYGLNVLAFA